MKGPSGLLSVANFDQENLKEHTLLLMEFQVNPETAPYLVSSSASVMWLRRAHGGRVRAAVREVSVSEYYREVVTEVYTMGTEAEWGNTAPLTLEGVETCVQHLHSYDLAKVTVLSHEDVPWESWGVPVDEPWNGAEIVLTSWMPPGMVVVVPEDRGFVGTIWKVGTHKILSVIHNASRGMAVAWDGK